jgi:hypothetical protein
MLPASYMYIILCYAIVIIYMLFQVYFISPRIIRVVILFKNMLFMLVDHPSFHMLFCECALSFDLMVSGTSHKLANLISYLVSKHEIPRFSTCT